MKCEYGGCREEAIYLSSFCWTHLPDKEGYRKSLPSAARGEKGLIGCNLKKVNLSQLDLSGVHMFDARLDGADLVGTNLSECDLTHCNMTNADLTKANLSCARLWNAGLGGANLSECDLTCADLWNAKLFNAKLWQANFEKAKSISRNSFSNRSAVFDRAKINEDGPSSAEDCYRNLKTYFMARGMYNDASWASFKEKVMERLVLKKAGNLNYFPSLLMSLICGYGEKPFRIISASLVTIVLFSLFFFSYGAVQASTGSSQAPAWSDCLYFSTITFTTVGYGDIVPKPVPFFRLMAASESFLGVFLTGLFIFTLARKYSAR